MSIVGTNKLFVGTNTFNRSTSRGQKEEEAAGRQPLPFIKTLLLNAVAAAYRVGLRIAVAAGNIIGNRRYDRAAWVNTNAGRISGRSATVNEFHLGLVQVGNFCFVELQAACIHFDLFHACLI